LLKKNRAAFGPVFVCALALDAPALRADIVVYLKPTSSCCQCWCEQAASYCETLAVLREFCGCSPAYCVPALPSGLNADPGADAALPGVFGALALPHEALGWPVIAGPCTVLGVVVVGVWLVRVPAVCFAAAAPGAARIPPPGTAANAAIDASRHVEARMIVDLFMA
jgi:hypothetical protein